MLKKNYAKLERDFYEKYKDSQFSIVVGTAEQNKRLDAAISFNTNQQEKDKGTFFRYIEEGLFSSIFRSPKKFFEKIDKIFQEEAMPFANNSFKRLNQ